MEQEYLHGKHSRSLKTGQGNTVASTLFWERRELCWALSSSVTTVTVRWDLIMRNCPNKSKRELLVRSH